MAESEDTGMLVSRLAKQVTPDQVAEMSAIRWASFNKSRCPILLLHRAGEVMAPLEQWGMIEWRDPPRGGGWLKSKWGMPCLTELGERVLHHVAENAMVAGGVMAAAPDPCSEEAA